MSRTLVFRVIVTAVTVAAFAACTSPTAPSASHDCGGTTVGSSTHC